MSAGPMARINSGFAPVPARVKPAINTPAPLPERARTERLTKRVVALPGIGVGGGWPAPAIVSVSGTAGPAASALAARTENVNVPAADVVPDMTPVAGFSTKPAGRPPVTTQK